MVQSIVLWIDAAVTPLYCSNGHYPESSATVYVRDNSSNFRDFSAIAQTIIESQSWTKQTKNKKHLTKSITRLIYSSVSFLPFIYSSSTAYPGSGHSQVQTSFSNFANSSSLSSQREDVNTLTSWRCKLAACSGPIQKTQPRKHPNQMPEPPCLDQLYSEFLFWAQPPFEERVCFCSVILSVITQNFVIRGEHRDVE